MKSVESSLTLLVIHTLVVTEMTLPQLRFAYKCCLPCNFSLNSLRKYQKTPKPASERAPLGGSSQWQNTSSVYRGLPLLSSDSSHLRMWPHVVGHFVWSREARSLIFLCEHSHFFNVSYQVKFENTAQVKQNTSVWARARPQALHSV